MTSKDSDFNLLSEERLDEIKNAVHTILCEHFAEELLPSDYGYQIQEVPMLDAWGYKLVSIHELTNGDMVYLSLSMLLVLARTLLVILLRFQILRLGSCVSCALWTMCTFCTTPKMALG